jgi:hypothetical protein
MAVNVLKEELGVEEKMYKYDPPWVWKISRP